MDLNHHDRRKAAEQPPPVPSHFQTARRHRGSHMPPARRQTVLSTCDHLECAIKTPVSKTTISPHALQALGRVPEQTVHKQANEELHATKYQTTTHDPPSRTGSPRRAPPAMINLG